MDRALKRWLWLGAGVVAGLLLLNTLVTYRSMRVLSSESGAMAQRYQLLDTSEELGLLLEKAELDGRDLLAGGEGPKPARFAQDRQFIEEKLDTLFAMSRTLGSLSDHTAKLHAKIRGWLNHLSAKIEADADDPNAATQAVAADREEFDRVRKQVDELEAGERRLLRAHQQVLTENIRSAAHTTLGVTLLAIAALGASVQSLRRYLNSRQTAEELLRGDREWFCNTLGSIGAGVIATDMSGRVRFINPVGESLTGMSAAEARGEPLADVFRTYAGCAVEASPDPLAALEADGEDSSRDLVLFAQDGVQRTVLASRTLIRDSRGKPHGSVLVFADVTRQRQFEAALQEQHRLLEKSNEILESRVQERTAALEKANAELELAKDAAEAGNRAKSMFLANMSHEIRTPLNAIMGMTELALRENLSPQQREYLHTVKDAGESLLTLIGDILDFSKIESGHVALHAEPFDLRESLGDTLKTFAIRAGQKGIELVFDVEPDVPQVVVGDYSRLRQVAANLVANAIKFTDEGQVVVKVRLDCESQGGCLLRFTVSDSGIGIPKDRQAAIFNTFEQADSTTTRRYGGTGLGLAIASRLVELMDGHIWVESEGGRGSDFHFTAFFSAAPKPVNGADGAIAKLEGLTALVIDDNEAARDAIAATLTRWKMRVHHADSAAAAREAARKLAAPASALICDAHLSGIATALEAILGRDRAATAAVVRLVSPGHPTAPAIASERCGTTLLKPVKESELRDAVLRAAGLSPAESAVTTTRIQPRPRLEHLKILLAEDSLVNRQLALALLKGEGHEVAVACTGAEAVGACERAVFDLILMDVQMPEMDGLEATALLRLRERQTGRHTPIIAMTAHALKGDRERCLAAGMDGYVSKPIRADDLFLCIASTLAAGPAAEGKRPEEAAGGSRETPNAAVVSVTATHRTGQSGGFPG